MLTKFISALALGALLALNVCAADTASLNIPVSDISLDGSRLVLQPHDAAVDDAFESSMLLYRGPGGGGYINNGTALQGYAESPAQRSDIDDYADEDDTVFCLTCGGGWDGGYLNGTALQGYVEGDPVKTPPPLYPQRRGGGGGDWINNGTSMDGHADVL